MSNMISHPYHLVDESPWPLMASVSGLGLTFGLVKWFHSQSITLTLVSLTMLLLIMYQWWRDVSREGTYQGLHTSVVELGLRWGMVLFITSEVFFFLSFFWAFFHSSLSVNVELGSMWPPMGISTFNPFGVPLLNTLILLSSGVSVTWAHHALLEGKFIEVKISLLITVLLGLYFTLLQAMEYYEATFNISDSVYGSTFFIATGFHGLHVIVGTTFLIVCLARVLNGSLGSKHHFGFEAAAWYWHFVDVVWLFLYMCIYWWGGL
uniref:Cytochrome c oxidase subunit 3 n=1 Tax=Sinergasilus polycolpus TaxID=232557 RepID=C1INF5_SINPO|nr:cytochrome c oxidase subunit III [Sinergasilus polycolpus]ACB99584.1 cytchrome c oxidase subunit III [Sinergasilus polycolpus]ALG63350.1 cytochrome c oxidase subunit III [Sinergasilus polycolpus]